MTREVTIATADDVPVVVGAIMGVAMIAWLGMFWMHGIRPGYVEYALVWSAMTIGMMTPSAVPMVVAYMRVSARAQAHLSPLGCVAAFIAAYLILWVAFGVAAGVLQAGLHALYLVDDHMQIASRPLGAALLIAAAIYQLTPLKHVCVSKCRSPLGFLLGRFRTGYAGSFILGLHHGAFCIGCCWLLMLLAWVGGMMNIAWMAALSLLVIAEKCLPRAGWLVNAAGGVLMVAGIALLLTSGSDDFLALDALSSLCHALL